MFAFYPFFHMQISRQKFTITPFLLQYLISRDEMRSANLALISGRQMHRINACIFLVAITKTQNQSIFLFGSALRLSVWLIYNLSFKLFYIYKILSLAFRTKQPQRRQNDCLAAAGIISFTLFLFMTIERCAILFHKRPPIIIFVFLLLTRFFSHFHFFIEIFSKSMSFPLAINHGYSDV